MMRKVLFLLPLVALTVASCSNSDELTSNDRALNSDELRFRTMMGNNTRAASTDLAALQTNGFKVIISGDAITTNANTTSSTPAASHFNGEASVSWNGSAWALASALYWDKGNGNTATFLAYNNIYSGGTSYSVPADIDAQNDLVMAYNTGTRAANASAGIALNFKHLLSQIQIKATNNAADVKQVEVIGVKLSNVPVTSTLTVPSTADFVPAWSAPDAASAKTMGAFRATDDAGTAVTLTAAAQDVMFGHDFFMVLPQTIAAADLSSTTTTGFYISLLVRITRVADGSAIYPDDNTKYAYTSVALPVEWEAGKRYVYTLNFYTTDSGAGQIDPNPDDNGEGDTPTGGDDGKKDDDPGQPGAASDDTDVLPLAFTVTVEDWIEVPSSQSLGD